MALVETDSLILKSYNLAEADKIVVLFTHDHGVVRGVAKGAKRLKSRFGSGLEPFSSVKVTYFQKENLELVSIQKVELDRSYFAAASQPDFLTKFAYLADLLIAISPPHDPNETLFRMVKASLEAADDRPDLLSMIGVYFELWLLRLSGFLPEWSRCDHCDRSPDEGEVMDLSSGFQLMCRKCRRSSGAAGVSGTHREIYASARRLSPAQFAEKFANDVAAIAELSTILKRIISQAIGRDVRTESLAANYN